MTTTHQDARDIGPPSSEVGAVGWLRHNLFGSLPSSVATIVIGTVLLGGAWLVADWAVNFARWGVVTSNMRLFLVGLYPPEQIWRVALALAVVSVLAGLSAGTWPSRAIRTMAMMLAGGELTIAVLCAVSGLGAVAVLTLVAASLLVVGTMSLARRWRVPRLALLAAWLVSFVLVEVLLYGLGEATSLPSVSASVWGGLLLTILLAVASILLSFPIGVALALGRRSRLPVVRLLSTAYIELVRAVPLITILFMAGLLLPLFLPGEITIDRVVRAIGGLTVFSAAYVAENVRGGLQAIPVGQVEAAQAIGLNGFQINLFIVLPQALRMVIPANVGLFISLLKDTTLVFIVSLLEILGIGRQVLAQSEWLGAAFEVYVFVAVVFFVLSFALSQASYRLEKELGVGER